MQDVFGPAFAKVEIGSQSMACRLYVANPFHSVDSVFSRFRRAEQWQAMANWAEGKHFKLMWSSWPGEDGGCHALILHSSCQQPAKQPTFRIQWCRRRHHKITSSCAINTENRGPMGSFSPVLDAPLLHAPRASSRPGDAHRQFALESL